MEPPEEEYASRLLGLMKANSEAQNRLGHRERVIYAIGNGLIGLTVKILGGQEKIGDRYYDVIQFYLNIVPGLKSANNKVTDTTDMIFDKEFDP